MKEHNVDRSAVRFAESAAPPWWLRLLIVGVAGGWVVFGALTRGADGAAVGSTIILVVWGLGLELGQAIYGGVRIDATRLWVGRRSVALAALDLDTLRFEAGTEIYAVFARGALLSNPMWLPDTVAIDGQLSREGAGVDHRPHGRLTAEVERLQTERDQSVSSSATPRSRRATSAR